MKKILGLFLPLMALVFLLYLNVTEAQIHGPDDPGLMQSLPSVLITEEDSLTDSTTFVDGVNNFIKTGGLNQLTLYVGYDWAAASQIQWKCYALRYGSSTEYSINSCDASASPVISCSEGQYTMDVSADGNFVFNLPVNYYGVNCKFTGTGATTDSITIYARRGGI